MTDRQASIGDENRPQRGASGAVERAREAARDLGREAAHYVAREEWDDTAQDYLLPLDADDQVRCADNCKTCRADRALNDAIDSLASALAEAERQRDEARGPYTVELDLDGQMHRWSLMFANDERVISIRLEKDEALAAAEAALADTREALRAVGNAYGCFAGCTGALPGAPPDGSGHTPPCRSARALLNPPLEEG